MNTLRYLVSRIHLPFFVFATLLTAQHLPAMAQGSVSIAVSEGTNHASDLGAVANMVQTLQYVAFNWIAPLFGTFLAIYGIYKIALRETMVGTVSLLCGGAMFFVKNILEGLQKITGSGG